MDTYQFLMEKLNGADVGWVERDLESFSLGGYFDASGLEF
jgi:hypothetical protein